MLNYIDDDAPYDQSRDLPQRVKQYSHQLEELMTEWKLEELMHDPDTTNDLRCLLADHISECCLVRSLGRETC